MIPDAPHSRSVTPTGSSTCDTVPHSAAESPVECCSIPSTSGSSGSSTHRRHGRFIVQPLLETSPCGIRAPSPAGGKPPLGPGMKLQQSPQPSSIGVDRRPSRIIGRFEVSELFPLDSLSITESRQGGSIGKAVTAASSSVPFKDRNIPGIS